jgi:hypothetical protein
MFQTTSGTDPIRTALPGLVRSNRRKEANRPLSCLRPAGLPSLGDPARIEHAFVLFGGLKPEEATNQLSRYFRVTAHELMSERCRPEGLATQDIDMCTYVTDFTMPTALWSILYPPCEVYLDFPDDHSLAYTEMRLSWMREGWPTAPVRTAARMPHATRVLTVDMQSAVSDPRRSATTGSTRARRTLREHPLRARRCLARDTSRGTRTSPLDSSERRMRRDELARASNSRFAPAAPGPPGLGAARLCGISGTPGGLGARPTGHDLGTRPGWLGEMQCSRTSRGDGL